MFTGVASSAGRSIAVTLAAALLSGCGGGHHSSVLPLGAGTSQGKTRSPHSAVCSSTQSRGTVTSYALPTSNARPIGIAVSGGTVWAAENYGNKIAKLVSGTVTEYNVPTSSAQVQNMAIGSDGNAWYTEQGANKIARMNADNTMTEFATGVAVGAPLDLVSGTDGSLWSTVQHSTLLNITASGSITTAAVPAFGGDTYAPYMMGLVIDSAGTAWFADVQNNSIVQRTSGGTLTKHAIPTTSATPMNVTVGPDGRIWFTEYTAPKVGAIDPSTGTMTEYSLPSGSYPADIVSTCGNLWISEKGTDKIGMMTTGGTLTEYSMTSSTTQPYEMAVDNDGNIWFTAYTGNSIGKITTSNPPCSGTGTRGTVTSYALPTSNARPIGIAEYGGTVWAAENYGNKIAKLVGGTVTEYNVPTSSAQVQNMAVGSDGNAWYTEQGANKIARMNADNTMTEFATGVAVGAPLDLALGTDGSLWSTVQHSTLLNITASGSITTAAVPAFGGDTYAPYMLGLVIDSAGTAWFGDTQNNSIVQRTSGGTLTKHAIPTTSATPMNVTVGPDGRIWFTEYTAPKVGAIDPSTGTMTEYAVPTGSYPADIVSACGNLWITEKGTDKIGMMTTGGTLTEYSMTSSTTQPYEMAVDSDGNIWFTAYTGNSIGKITTSGT